MQFKKIIVGIDFSDASTRAVNVAVALAKGLGAEVVLVHAIAPGAEQADSGDMVESVRPGIERQLREICERYAAESGVKMDWGVVDGAPADEIATFAERWQGDVIVVGTTGRSGLARALLGSVAERLLRIAKVPVMVVGPHVRT